MASRKKKVVILGSTGSIGESAIKVANDLSDRIEIIGIGIHDVFASSFCDVRQFSGTLTP